MKLKSIAGLCALLALATPAQATEVDKAVGLYAVVHYETKCKVGSLSKDAQQVVMMWLKSLPPDVKLAAMLRLSKAQGEQDPASFCARLQGLMSTELDNINKQAKIIMQALR